MELNAARLTIVAGHYGSGKTEFSINLACAMARAGHPCTLCDMDVINPYFRCREKKDLLTEKGVQLIAPTLQGAEADMPALPPELLSVFQNRELFGVVDLGGNGIGARVLARFRRELVQSECRVLAVVNANRPETCSPQQTANLLWGIERAMGLPFTGLVNNTHLCGETRTEDILAGAEMAVATAELMGLPLLCHTVRRGTEIPSHIMGDIFPIEIFMKKPWEEEAYDCNCNC